ncbi:hypothetical protein ABL78_5386 [Leptomonas seymouri]|uniref:Uncharacterized protein n=1 Tax=Leptomonas seymouri TaxID=5684 RepID=A0A0N0P541_LEPSE|nr:hypothetical protein ABL78_5386 [Leptomonas seymouri]|eukprot:KPI85557.1 hypothetical protein ABL78_5386 [Leptomonas seymouri]
MGCANQKLRMQQIAYQRDFLGACWNSSLGEEEAEEYMASRWMGISKEVMALYTNNHCFAVRTLKKDEKARAEAAAAGKPALQAADDSAGIALGFGGDAGGGGGGVQSPNMSVSPASPVTTITTGKARPLDNTAPAFSPLSDCKQRKDYVSPLSGRQASPLPQPPALPKPAVGPIIATTMPIARTTVRQGTSHAHGVNNNSVASVKDDHSAVNSASAQSGLGRAPAAERTKRGSDPAALRNVVKDSVESGRIVHADHPYLQRHGLSVYSGVVFRCAPAHRLYHRISLVPDVSMKRLYQMQMVALAHSGTHDASSSLFGRPGTEGKQSEPHHLQPCASSSDYPRTMPPNDTEERGVLPMTPQMPPSNVPSMVPTPMVRPLKGSPGAAMDSSVTNANPPLRGSDLDRSLPLPSLPLGAVSARHLRFASGPEAHQSAIIDAWAAENPLSAFNNYPVKDCDVAGVTASRPPVIIGSVTATELQALPPNTEICFGGWLYVSLQDEQERLRKSLKLYAARQRRRAAKAAAEGTVRFPAASSSAAPGGRTSRVQNRRGDPQSTQGVDEAEIDVEGDVVNLNGTMGPRHSLTATPTLRPLDSSSPNGGLEALKGADSGAERLHPADSSTFTTSPTAVYKDPSIWPPPRMVNSEDNSGEAADESKPGGLDGVLSHTTVSAKSSPAGVNAAAASSTGDGNEATAASQCAMPAPSNEPTAANEIINKAANSYNGTIAASSKPPALLLPLEGVLKEPLNASIRPKVRRSASAAPLREPSLAPSRLHPRSSSMPPAPMIAPASNSPAMPPPLHHTGRYAREAMEADVLNASWLPYAYIIVAVPMYECSLVPTTFHAAYTRHKAVSLNLANAQSRQAYGVGCITSVRYGGVMVIEYRDKVDEADDAAWIAELMRVGRIAQQGNSGDDSNNASSSVNMDPSVSAPFRSQHHSALHHARAEKLRRVKSRIWHKLRRQGLHVVLAATRMADRRHRQHRAFISMELNTPFINSRGDAAAAAMGASHMTQQPAANGQHAASALRNPPSSTTRGFHRASLSSPQTGVLDSVRDENLGVMEGGAEEMNEAMEDTAEEFDSTASNLSEGSDSDKDSVSEDSRLSPGRCGGAAAESKNGAGGGEGGDSARGGGRLSSRKHWGRWWPAPLSLHRHKRREKAHGVTTREDRLLWAEPQMTDDFYLRGTFRQIGGMKYLDAVSLMDGCPVSELVQGIRRWVVNLLSMPIKARPICLFLQRYEGIAASLRVTPSQLVAAMLAPSAALGKHLTQGNCSFHMPSTGVPGADENNMDEAAAWPASPNFGDPVMDQVASPSVLVNASFASLKANALPPTRTLAYQTYYCGPLEPEVHAVLPPEIQEIIASCQARQLPDVLKQQVSKEPAAAALSSVRAAESRSLPPPELLSGNHSAATNSTNPAAVERSTVRARSAFTDASSPSPAAAGMAASTLPAGPLSPDLASSHPASNGHHCIDVGSLPLQQQQRRSHPQQQKPGSPAQRNVSQFPSVAHADSVSALTHPQVKVASPHSSFGAPSTSAKTASAVEADITAGHAKPPANTVPTTITEFLFYDDPTKQENSIGNSFTAANSLALSAAAAALVLQGNAKGHTVVSNASLAAPSVSTGSFPAIHAPGEDPMVAAPHSLNGGSFDHVKGLAELETPPGHHLGGFAKADNGDEAIRTGTKAVEASKTHAQHEQECQHRKMALSQSLKTAEDSGDASTSACRNCEDAVKGAPGPSAAPPQLKWRPEAVACNRRNAENHEGDDSDNEADECEMERQLAERELRALKSELDEMVSLASIARTELLDRLDELLLLSRVFLPHTHPDKVDPCLVTMKMLRQYPEEVPVKEIHTDWVPLLMTLLTGSRESLLCSSSHACDYPGWMVGSAQGLLTTYNGIVDASDMRDASKRRQACMSGQTKYTVDPLPPMPIPRQLHDIVIASQPVHLTKPMLHEMKRLGMESSGLSFSFSGGSLGVLAGIIHYYSDFLRSKYRGEVLAAGGRAKDAGATVLDVLSRGGYNVLLRRIWIWGVMPESKKSKRLIAAAATKLMQRKLHHSDDATSDSSARHAPLTTDEHEHVTSTASGNGGSVQAVGTPFRGAEAYALYDAIAHYLSTLEELCMEHNGNNFMVPQTWAKRRSMLMSWRRGKDSEPVTANGGVGAAATNGKSAPGDAPNSGSGGFLEDTGSARDLVPIFEVCVATNYYYKCLMDEAHRPAGNHSTGGDGAAGLLRQASSAHIHNGNAVTRLPSMVGAQARLSSREHDQSASEGPRGWTQTPSSEKTPESKPIAKPSPSSHENGGDRSSHNNGAVLETLYCGGEEAMKKDTPQRKATKKFYGFLSDHYEQWRARHSEDKTMNAYVKRISVSMN